MVGKWGLMGSSGNVWVEMGVTSSTLMRLIVSCHHIDKPLACQLWGKKIKGCQPFTSYFCLNRHVKSVEDGVFDGGEFVAKLGLYGEAFFNVTASVEHGGVVA